MNLLSWIIIGALGLWLACALWRMAKNRGGCSCSGDCGGRMGCSRDKR